MSKAFTYYLEVLRKGIDAYERIHHTRSGGLAWAYRLVGKYHETPLSHVQHMERYFISLEARA